MPLFMLTIVSSEDRSNVRYRKYTTDERMARFFAQIPPRPFLDYPERGNTVHLVKEVSGESLPEDVRLQYKVDARLREAGYRKYASKQPAVKEESEQPVKNKRGRRKKVVEAEGESTESS